MLPAYVVECSSYMMTIKRLNSDRKVRSILHHQGAVVVRTHRPRTANRQYNSPSWIGPCETHLRQYSQSTRTYIKHFYKYLCLYYSSKEMCNGGFVRHIHQNYDGKRTCNWPQQGNSTTTATASKMRWAVPETPASTAAQLGFPLVPLPATFARIQAMQLNLQWAPP